VGFFYSVHLCFVVICFFKIPINCHLHHDDCGCWVWLMGSKPFDNFGVIHRLTWLVSSKSLWISSSQLLHPCDTKALLFLPPSTHDLLPFHHHLFIVCVILHTTLCVCLSFSFFFLHTHTHTHTSLNSYNVKYHIHKVCFPKVHAMVHVMDIPKYFIFLHM